MDKSLVDRFMGKVSPCPASGCWLWEGAPAGNNGYGAFYFDNKRIFAHRFSWELHKGVIDSGKLVLHTCDVPACVNPNHLFLGTMKENMEDRDRKGRGAKDRGEDHAQAKLTEDDVRFIRESNKSVKALMAQFHTCKGNIRSIRKRITWKHI